MALTALLVSSSAGAARADVLIPPPADCPAGSKGRTSHSGPHCAPRTCERGCEEGLACRPTDLCIVQRQGANRVHRFTFEVVTGPCPADRKCPEGACETRDVCVPGAAPVEPPIAGPDAATGPVPAAATVPEPAGASAPDAQVLEDQKLGTEVRKPAACSAGAGDGALALAVAFAVALLALLALKRRGQDA
jgi:hypothetical protein